MSAECPRHPACGCAPASPDPCICPLTPAGEALLASGLMQADHPDAREMVASVERQAVARHREQADAEVARLREALRRLIDAIEGRP